MKKVKAPKVDRLVVLIMADRKKKLKEYCANNGHSLSWMADKLIGDFVDGIKKSK